MTLAAIFNTAPGHKPTAEAWTHKRYYGYIVTRAQSPVSLCVSLWDLLAVSQSTLYFSQDLDTLGDSLVTQWSMFQCDSVTRNINTPNTVHKNIFIKEKMFSEDHNEGVQFCSRSDLPFKITPAFKVTTFQMCYSQSNQSFIRMSTNQ